jgi:hypothetical protein
VLVALVAVGLAVGAALLVRPQAGDEPGPANAAQPTAPGDGASPAAATSSAPYTLKAEPTQVATDAPSTPSGGWVDVVLTYAGFDPAAGTVQGNGFAAGVIEDGGTCTLTLTKGSNVVTATSRGAADATTTTCGLIETPTGLASGTWDAVLSYESDRPTARPRRSR